MRLSSKKEGNAERVTQASQIRPASSPRGIAVSPGSGFGTGGEGYVRFALIENEHRIAQAIRSIRRGLPKLG